MKNSQTTTGARIAFSVCLLILTHRGVVRDISTDFLARERANSSYGTAKESASMTAKICSFEILDYLNRTRSSDSPRLTGRLFLHKRAKVQIVEEERAEGRSLWRWQLALKGLFTLEGKHWSPTAMHTDVVLTVIVRNLADPDNRHGPEMWIDSWERRMLWSELETIRRATLEYIEGHIRTLN